jgi:hypothetical protein
MAAMTNLLLKDDATTPIEYTFIPVSDTPNPFWRTSTASVPLDGQMRCNVTQERTKSGDYKFTIKFEVPVMETLGASGTSAGYVAPPKVAYVNTGIFTMFASARSTRQDRANLLKIVAGAVAGGSSTTSTGTLDGASAGDAWKNSTAPIPQVFVDGIVPN